MQPSQRRVFNLTGTVLHTNLGRAPLPEEAIAAAVEAMRDPTTLEYEIETGKRGERDNHVAGWLTRLTGAEAALTVNNNAGALVLALNTLAEGRETIVSRGELIEIGGSFRLPDIMARAGTRLREVGTTNRTHLADYAAAIGPQTGLVLKVHTSNYAIHGFTAAAPAAKLAALARDHAIPFVEDLGSGSLVDFERWGLPHEPTVTEALARGADLVTFSGDKLLGGPQAGLVVGRAELIHRLARNPLKRALRLDKIRLAALEAVLRLYADPDRLAERLPALRLLARPMEQIRALGERLLPAVERAFRDVAEVALIETKSQIGSGALPDFAAAERGVGLAASGATFRQPRSKHWRAHFAAMPIPVIGRIEAGRVILDLRCLEDEAAFIAQLDGPFHASPSPPRRRGSRASIAGTRPPWIPAFAGMTTRGPMQARFGPTDDPGDGRSYRSWQDGADPRVDRGRCRPLARGEAARADDRSGLRLCHLARRRRARICRCSRP